jgi:hypothetical protein
MDIRRREHKCELNHLKEFYILGHNVMAIRWKLTDVSEEYVSIFSVEE